MNSITKKLAPRYLISKLAPAEAPTSAVLRLWFPLSSTLCRLSPVFRLFLRLRLLTSGALILVVLCLLSSAPWSSGAFAQQYQVTAIEPPEGYTASRAMGINNYGEVVGRFHNIDPLTGDAIDRQAFIWDSTNGAWLLPSLTGASRAWEVNDNALVSGYYYAAENMQHAVIWDVDGGSLIDIGTLSNGNGVEGAESSAHGMNSFGETVGNADIPNDAGTFMPFHAFYFNETDGIYDLGTLTTAHPEWANGYSIAYGINNNGEIVGIAHDRDWNYRPFIDDETNGMQALQIDPAHPNGEWYAVVINDSGLIGGHVNAATNQSFPYYWPNKASTPIKITMPLGFPYGEIYGINAFGQLVGIMWSSDQEGALEHAFIFDNENGVRDLNALVDTVSGWVLNFARDINDSGQIAGHGKLNGNERGLILALQANEINLACAFDPGGAWIWDGSAWSQINVLAPTDMLISGSALHASFEGMGLWNWDGSAWIQINTIAPTDMVASGPVLYGDFGSNGLWKWDGSNWSQLTAGDPQSVVAAGSVLYGDFGSNGLWKWDGSGWSQLNAGDPQNMVASGSVLYGDFGPNGLLKWDGRAWSQLTAGDPQRVVASGPLLYGDFGSDGLWKWDGSGWSQLTPGNPQDMAASGSILYASFEGLGLFRFDGTVLSQISSAAPTSMVASGSVLYADFAEVGLWKWQAGAWYQLSTSDPSIMVAGF